MKRTLYTIFSVVAVLLCIGIVFMRLMGPKVGNTFSTISNSLPGEDYGGSAPMPAEAPARALDSSVSTSSGQLAQPQKRIVIQNAELALVVKDPVASMKGISDLAKEYGGFVVSSDLSQTTTVAGKEIPNSSITIRVPSEKLEEALEKIKKGAVDVQYEKVSGQDVTSEYVDLQSRLTAKQAAEQKLLEIMDQSTRAQDVLNAYAQVQSIQTEIEQLKGQIRLMEESAALSAISVQLIAEEGIQPIQVGPWKPSGTAKEAVQDLIVFSQNFVDFLIYFVLNTLPKLIMIGIPLFLIYLAGRAVYRRFSKPTVEVEEVKG